MPSEEFRGRLRPEELQCLYHWNGMGSFFILGSLPMTDYEDALGQAQRRQEYDQTAEEATKERDHSRVSSRAMQALEVARESPVEDPVIVRILDRAIYEIWRRVQQQPNTYVMSRDEFAIFNFFQNTFRDSETARAARARYWDCGNLTGS
jgi:hypothetical protein